MDESLDIVRGTIRADRAPDREVPGEYAEWPGCSSAEVAGGPPTSASDHQHDVGRTRPINYGQEPGCTLGDVKRLLDGLPIPEAPG